MMIFSLLHDWPPRKPSEAGCVGKGGATEWSECPLSGGRSGKEFVPTCRRRRRLKRTGATASVFTGAWGRLATNELADTFPLCKLPYVRDAQFCELSPLKSMQFPGKIFLYKEMEDLLS